MSSSRGYIGRSQMVCPSVLRLALVAPGASTLKFASTQSSKNAGSQCGDLTIVEWKSLGSSPTLKNKARSTSITVPVVTTTVRLPDLRTAVGPMVGSYFHVSHFIVPSASEITDQLSSSGTNWCGIRIRKRGKYRMRVIGPNHLRNDGVTVSRRARAWGVCSVCESYWPGHGCSH